MCHKKGFSRYGSRKDAVPAIPISALVNVSSKDVPSPDSHATEYTEEYAGSAVDEGLQCGPKKEKQR